MAKKSLKYFLLLFFALILSVLPPPGEVHATGAGSAVTTDVRYGIASQTSSMVGQGEQYLVTNTLSGTTSTLYSPFSYVYLDKNIFVTPVVSDVTLEAGAVNASIIYSDPNYYIIKIDYSRLDTGYAAVPVKATLKNSAVQNGETFHIPVKLFEAGKNPATDAPLASSNDQFVAKAYPVGIISPDTSAVANNNRKSEYISDEATNAAHDRLSTDFVSTLSGFGYSGPSNTANGGVTMVPAGQGAGMDKRKVQFKITLPATAVWDPSLPNNVGWTYNSADRTITQTVDRGLATIVQPPFSLKWDGNQPVTLAPTWTKITMQQVTTLVNDDGTLDNSTRRSGEIYYHVSYVRRIRIRKTLLGEGGYLVPRDADYKYNYLVSVDQFGGTRPQTASSVTFRMIEDEPQARSLLTGYELRVRPERFTATELAKLSHNKLIGSDNGTTWTTIATDITPVQVSNATDYRANSVSTTLTTPPEYRYFRLVFNDDITISQFDEDAVGFIVQTQLTPATHTAYINDLNAHVNDVYSKLVRNYGRVKNAAGQELGYSNADAYISNPYASLSLTNFGMQINNNGSTTVVSTGGTITINPRINYNSLLWDPRTANNARMVLVADSDLAFDSASFTTNANYFTSMDTTPIVVQNYKGNVGKTAYIFPINNLTFPGSVYNNYGNRQINRADFTRFLFKPTSGMDGGPHEIKAILSWDNNTTAASSAAPGVVYSSDNKNDPYDANDNGNTNDRLPTLTYNYTFVPPQAMVLGKKVKLSTESVYQTKMKADKGDILDYQVRVWNNTNDPVQDLHVIDVFPYAGDKFIVKDGSGVYHDRGSKIYPKAISGVTVNNSKFDVYYSIDPPSDNINGNVNATWVPASSISDWSAVTMFKADLKNGQSVVANEEVTFNYKVEMPDTKENAATDTANNSVASWRGNNLDGANEFTDSQVGTHKYNIATHAFYDLNGNGVYDSTDLNIADRPYVLVKLDAAGTESVVESGRTDANGNISFTNKLSNEGNYKLYVENLTSDSFAVPNVPSSAAVIGNDFTSFVTRASVLNADQTPIPNTPWSSVAINLTRDNPTAIKNLGLKTDFYNLTVKHIKDEDGSNLVLDVTTREPRDTRYTTAPITTDPNFEVDTANLPANANGSYTADTTVTYHYVRRNAGDVTVHHYETGTTTELYATSSTATPAAEVLSGARQMGKPYQTYRRDISTAGSYAIPHYHLVGTPQGPTSGTFDATPKTVTYYYERNTSPDVTIKYIDIDTGENLTRPESLGSSTMVNTPTVLSGANKEGLAWSSSQLPVDNYDFISSSTPTSGVFGDGTTTVTYSYRRKNAGNITVHHYERGTTTELYSPTVGAAPGPEVIDGTRKLGLTYQSQDRSAQIMNYHLYQAPSPTLLTFTTAPQEISYYYERDNGSSITIHYIDDGTGNELYSAIPGGTPSAVVLDGTNKLGLTYTTQSKTFPHFHLVSSPVNPVVTFGNTPVEVYYRYRRDDAGDVKVHYLEDGTNATLSPD
nr:MucBP domain-containing protein [uncultured Lachnoanaerobaculum sp.]